MVGLRRCLFGFVVVFLLTMAFAGRVYANSPTSGTCGANITWSLDGQGELTLSGTGNAYEYGEYDLAPWYEDHKDEIKKVTVGSGITGLGELIFYRLPNLKSVSLPQGLNSIGQGAFENCGLTSISIPNSVSKIGIGAFAGCEHLESITLPTAISELPDNVFRICKSLKSIVIPESVTSIGMNAFTECVALDTIVIPKKVRRIGAYVFEECYALKSIDVAEDNPEYSSADGVLFDKRRSVLIKCPIGKKGAYTIPDSVTEISLKAFCYCKGITAVTIPDSVCIIGDAAFLDCKGLKNVVIPGGVRDLEASIFGGCENLESVVISEGTETMDDYAFLDCHALKSVTIPYSLKKMDVRAFKECRNLEDIFYGGSSKEWEMIDGAKEALKDNNPRMHYTTRVTGVAIEPAALSVNEGQTLALTAKITPDNATIKDVTWKCDNTSVAAVDEKGNVTGLAPGKATVTVTTVNGKKTATCAVTVIERKIMTLNTSAVTLQAGKKASVKATLVNDSIADVSSSDSDVVSASFTGDTITVKAGKEAGKAKVTVKSASGIVAKFSVTVQTAMVTTKTLSLGKTKLTFTKKKEAQKVKVKASPDVVSTGEPIKVSVPDRYVKIVSAVYDKDTGLISVTAGKNGSAAVKVTAGKRTAYITVNVKAPIEVKGVKLSKRKVTLKRKGATVKLYATVSPFNAANKKVDWTSSDPTVAKVDKNGKVTAKKAGKATITATTRDGGKTVSCKVTVG